MGGSIMSTVSNEQYKGKLVTFQLQIEKGQPYSGKMWPMAC